MKELKMIKITNYPGKFTREFLLKSQKDLGEIFLYEGTSGTMGFYHIYSIHHSKIGAFDKYVKENMKIPHPHADLMIAFAKDSSLEFENSIDGRRWTLCKNPSWLPGTKYRIKKNYVKHYQVVLFNTSTQHAFISDDRFISLEVARKFYEDHIKVLYLIEESGFDVEV
jgi:hypothetical protein